MENTCSHCGYDRVHCQCGLPKNTSGQVRMFQNYTDYREQNEDYSTTSRINRSSPEERKFMLELIPINKEEMGTYLQRSEIADRELIKSAIYRHLFGTKKTWSCHTTTRYCIICTMAQELNVMRALLTAVSQKYPIYNDRLMMEIDEDQTTPILELQISLPKD